MVQFCIHLESVTFKLVIESLLLKIPAQQSGQDNHVDPLAKWLFQPSRSAEAEAVSLGLSASFSSPSFTTARQQNKLHFWGGILNYYYYVMGSVKINWRRQVDFIYLNDGQMDLSNREEMKWRKRVLLSSQPLRSYRPCHLKAPKLPFLEFLFSYAETLSKYYKLYLCLKSFTHLSH